MSVHNGEKYLEEAIESILHQTFSDFEFIIIDDGSNDSTPSLLARKAAVDSRILIHRFDNNRGLSTALNFGIRLARGQYVARMDADDISFPNRLQKQVRFMDTHPDIGVSGTWITFFGLSSGVMQYETEHDDIRSRLLFGALFCHPTVIFRRNIIFERDLFYDEQLTYAQDYELWGRVCNRVRVANLPEVLLQYREHDTSLGVVYDAQRRKMVQGILGKWFSELGVSFSQSELDLHERITWSEFTPDVEVLEQIESWLVKLRDANRFNPLYVMPSFEKVINERWHSFLNDAMRTGANRCFIARKVLFSPLRYNFGSHPFTRAKFLAKFFWKLVRTSRKR
jgi:glycosyltransferase involved in cell wall biosynthesis